jgi:hypothetical protein
MKKLLGAAAVCALTVGLVAAPGASAVKAPKQVGGTVSVSVTPSTVSAATPTTLTASGNVASNSGCRKNRTVHFAYVGATGPDLSGTTVTTGSNGNYSVSLPQPTTATTPASVTLQVTVDAATRKVGSKKKGQKPKKGRQFHCAALTGSFSPITVNP